jgi:hypothetical protein
LTRRFRTKSPKPKPIWRPTGNNHYYKTNQARADQWDRKNVLDKHVHNNFRPTTSCDRPVVPEIIYYERPRSSYIVTEKAPPKTTVKTTVESINYKTVPLQYQSYSMPQHYSTYKPAHCTSSYSIKPTNSYNYNNSTNGITNYSFN